MTNESSWSLETRFENKGYGKGDVDIDVVQNWTIGETLLVLGIGYILIWAGASCMPGLICLLY